MAVEAIRSCGVPCNAGPYYGEGSDQEEQGPAPPEMPEEIPPAKGGEDKPPATDDDSGEDKPPAEPSEEDGDGPSLDIDAAGRARVRARTVGARRAVPRTSPQTTRIPSLSGYCVVALVHGRKVPTQGLYQSVYQGRLYQFSCEQAKRKFDTTPETYAVAYGGFDPVQYVKSRQLSDGRMLTEYQGRLYSFASHANWEEFLRSPARYVVRSKKRDPNVYAASHTKASPARGSQQSR